VGDRPTWGKGQKCPGYDVRSAVRQPVRYTEYLWGSRPAPEGRIDLTPPQQYAQTLPLIDEGTLLVANKERRTMALSVDTHGVQWVAETPGTPTGVLQVKASRVVADRVNERRRSEGLYISVCPVPAPFVPPPE